MMCVTWIYVEKKGNQCLEEGTRVDYNYSTTGKNGNRTERETMPLWLHRHSTKVTDPHWAVREGIYGLSALKMMIVKIVGDYNGYDCGADDVSADVGVPVPENQTNHTLLTRTTFSSAVKILFSGYSERPMLLLHWPYSLSGES